MARILVIDDEAAVRMVLGRMLGRAGHEFLEARDAGVGLDLLRQREVDLVILDIYMPGLGGLATIPVLRKKWPALKIIAFSGVDRLVAVDVGPRAMELGANHFLRKPFETTELLRIIKDLLPQASPAPP